MNEELKEQLRKLTFESPPLFFWGIIISIFLTLLYPLEKIYNELEAVKIETIKIHDDLRKIETIKEKSNIDEYQNIQGALQQNRVKSEQGFWSAPTSSEATVDVKNWLEKELHKLDIKNPKISTKISSLRLTPLEHWNIEIDMRTIIPLNKSLQLVKVIETSEKWIEIEKMKISPQSIELSIKVNVLKS